MRGAGLGKLSGRKAAGQDRLQRRRVLTTLSAWMNERGVPHGQADPESLRRDCGRPHGDERLRGELLRRRRHLLHGAAALLLVGRGQRARRHLASALQPPVMSARSASSRVQRLPIALAGSRAAARAARVAATVAMVTMLAAGCASYGPSSLRVGQSADEVMRSMGTPTARYATPSGGTRLEFARGPFGKHTYMVDVDVAGRVQEWQQVLLERNFDVVKAGTPVQELLLALGTPTHRRHGGWQGGEVWSWRYQATFCQWFQVSVADGKVRDTSYGPDPICDVDFDDRVARWRVK
jgi:hypothetical protein